MYNQYINGKINEKIDYDIHLFEEYIIIYLNLIIKFFNKKEARLNLKEFIKDYFEYSINEYKLLKSIKKLEEKKEYEEICITILETLEYIYSSQYQYIENVLDGYQESIFLDDISYSSFRKKKFNNDYLLKENIRIKKLKR